MSEDRAADRRSGKQLAAIPGGERRVWFTDAFWTVGGVAQRR
jgi:hypothetical protein